MLGELAANWAAGKGKLHRKSRRRASEGATDDGKRDGRDARGQDRIHFERFDRLLESSEARRNKALREIERHRAAFGAAMRQAIDEVQDAEFRDVDTGEVVGAPPS